MLSQVQVIHGHQSQRKNSLKKNLVVGLHTLYHDGSIATYNLDTQEFKYLKFERITGVKNQHYSDLSSWKKYLDYLGYCTENIDTVFLSNSLNIINIISDLDEMDFQLIDHHECHHHSTSNFNSIVLDDVGSQQDCLSIFKKHKIKEKLLRYNNQGLGKTLQFLWWTWFQKKKEYLLQVLLTMLDILWL